MSESGIPALDVASWRREVHSLYADVRGEADPSRAHPEWVEARSAMFVDHPASARTGEQELVHAPYDPAFRFVVPIEEAEPESWVYPTATDGDVPFARIGRVVLGTLGALDVWWLDSYGGGVFIPFKDATNGPVTYGAGRYVLDTVKGADLGRMRDRWVVDLNFAYNPSCVYNPAWACPLAPAGNRLPAEVPVGELLPAGYDG